MVAAISALMIGVLAGLFLRPFLDEYVLWRTAQLWRHESNGTQLEQSSVKPDRESLA